jgi:heterotetrameric sarcosine oxidase gamma subunit
VAESFTPVARGPILLAAVESAPVDPSSALAVSVRLTDASDLTKMHVAATINGQCAITLGVGFGHSRRHHNALVIGTGPGAWLIVGAAEAAQTVITEMRSAIHDEPVTVVDITHGRAMIRLEGVNAAAVLSKICAVNVSDRVMPVGTAVRTSVAKIAAGIVRVDPPADAVAGPTYLLHCDRSLGQYLFDCVLDAGAEFGLLSEAGQ